MSEQDLSPLIIPIEMTVFQWQNFVSCLDIQMSDCREQLAGITENGKREVYGENSWFMKCALETSLVTLKRMQDSIRSVLEEKGYPSGVDWTDYTDRWTTKCPKKT